MIEFEIEFLSHHREAQFPPNPAFPDGVAVDVSKGAATTCFGELPYPAECCGILLIRCRKCGASAAITTAGRRDDPRTIKLPCKAED